MSVDSDPIYSMDVADDGRDAHAGRGVLRLLGRPRGLPVAAQHGREAGARPHGCVLA